MSETSASSQDEQSADKNSSLERILEAAIESDALSDEPGGADVTKKLAKLMLSEVYKGPFQHPELLRKFDEVVENGAERAFRLTEREQAHRHDTDNRLLGLEEKQIQADLVDRRIVILVGFSFAFISLVGFFALVLAGFGGVALVSGAVSVVSAISTGVFAKKKGTN